MKLFHLFAAFPERFLFLNDRLKSDTKETPFPDHDAIDTFFSSNLSSAELGIEPSGEPSAESHQKRPETLIVISDSEIRVTSLHALAHYYDAGGIPSTTPGNTEGLQPDASPFVPVTAAFERPCAVVVRPKPQKSPGLNWRTPLLLYLATWVSVTCANGFVFALCVMTILTCHELGHYIQTRCYRVRSSLPYFIPLPIAFFGTMGAIIKMDGHIPNRRALFDIGISGPLAGLVPTLICCVIGIQQARVGPIAGSSLQFGDPLLFQWLSHLMFGPLPDDMTLYLNPIGMAGWFGLFLTTLNLFPLSQLDGGHVFYAILGKRAPALSVLIFTMIVVYVLVSQSYIWLVMLFLIYLMNPRHPPTQNDEPPIGVFRTVLGVATLLFIIIGFTINPISETLPDPSDQQPYVRLESDDFPHPLLLGALMP